MNKYSPISYNFLNRRFLRALTYTVTVLTIGLLLLLVANRRRLIHLDDLVQQDYFPDFFQPKSNHYVVDLSIRTCRPWNWASPTCGTPNALEGLYGDVKLEGAWNTIQKDLLLGSSWFSKKYLSYKTISSSYYEAHRGLVIVDVATATPDDCNIKGNNMCIPLQVLLLVAEKQKNVPGNTDKEQKALGGAGNKVKRGVDNSKSDPIDMRRAYIAKPKMTLENSVYPSFKEVTKAGWKTCGHGLWYSLAPAIDESIENIDVLFGDDAKDPRVGNSLIPGELQGLALSRVPKARISIRLGEPATNLPLKKLLFNQDGKFKILQIADIHFSTGVGECRDPVPEESGEGCEADPRSLVFINKILDIEKPDFVALTGDQIFGEGAPDPVTALLKVVDPLISRRIPWAMTVGNHDDESTLSREEMIKFASSLPYSYTETSDPQIDGFGNYRIQVSSRKKGEADAALYFMDSHSYSLDPKNDPGYDYFKQLQIDWLISSSQQAQEVGSSSRLSMAFFHIPLPEYRKVDQPMVGQYREGVTAPKKNTGMRSAFARAGIQVATCGHDHANDYCLLDSEARDDADENKVWLCFGGGAGEGGYGGYGGFIRRVRVFELNSADGAILSWKRLESEPQNSFDRHLMVENGQVIHKLLG